MKTIRCVHCGSQGEHIEVQAMVSGLSELLCCDGEEVTRFGCPVCFDTEHLDVVIMTSARIKQYGPDDVQTDIDESMDGSHEWDGDSTVHCTTCGHSAECFRFDREAFNCPKCGTAHNSFDFEDEGEGEEAGRTFRYCSEACRGAH